MKQRGLVILGWAFMGIGLPIIFTSNLEDKGLIACAVVFANFIGWLEGRQRYE